MEFLEANPDKNYWEWLSKNSAIFTYDYTKIKQNMFEYCRGYHCQPNADKWGDWGIGFDNDLD